MQRIRTIKPEFFKHEALFDAERASGLPLRVAFAALWTCADREGRFKWRPGALKTDCLPYDDVDFVKVLAALKLGGFIERYEIDGQIYGVIPSFVTHQHPNHREAKSSIPPPRTVSRGDPGTPGHASDDTHGHAPGEGKGREGKDTTRVGVEPTPLDLKKELFGRGLVFLKTNSNMPDAQARNLLGRWRRDFGDAAVLNALASAEGNAATDIVPYVTRVLNGKERPNVNASKHPGGLFADIAERLRSREAPLGRGADAGIPGDADVEVRGPLRPPT